MCILAVGKMLAAAESAADELESEGVKVTVWDVRVVSNPDPAMLADAAEHRAVITAEDGVRQGGAGMFIADALRATAPYGAAPPVVSVGTPRSYISQGKPDQILAQLGLDGPGLARSVREALRGLSGGVSRDARRRAPHPVDRVVPHPFDRVAPAHRGQQRGAGVGLARQGAGRLPPESKRVLLTAR